MSQATGTDGELLAEFVSAGGEAPFELLVERHGSLVLGVCRRVLGEHAGAEDAAQAVFLTLAHKARSLRRNASLGAWLHRVARNVALRARESRDLRRRREGEAGDMVRKKEAERSGAEHHLDGELDALPEKYRAALILRYMQGMSEEESAAALGVRPGTLSARLSRGRELLKQRLERRGARLSAAALAGLLAATCDAQLPATFAAATAKAGALALAGQAAAAGAVATNVALLTKGALNAMFWAKVKIAAAVLGTAAAVSAGVPVAMSAVKAAEKPAAAEKKPTAPKKLEWKSIGSSLFFTQWRLQGDGNPRFGAWWSDDAYRGSWTRRAVAVGKAAPIPRVDFKTRMAVAIHCTGNAKGGVFQGIKRVVEVPGEVRVHYATGFLDPRADRGPDKVLIELDRREKPVVFYENGKKVAEALPLRRPKGKGRYKVGLFAPKESHQVFRSIEQTRAHLVPIWGPLGAEVSWKRGGKNRAAATWIDSLGIDYDKEMVLAAFKGRMTANDFVAVTRVLILDGRVRVELTHWRSGKVGGFGYPCDLVTCPRRDLPVVFYENGKQVARVPFGKTEDKELAEFAKALKYARTAGVSTVTKCEIKQEKKKWHPPSWREVLLTRFERVLFGSRPPGKPYVVLHLQAAPFRSKVKPGPQFAKGDRIFYCFDSANGRSSALKWTAEREQAVKFALAPGWLACNRGYYRCPWCRKTPAPVVDRKVIPQRKCACGTPLAPGAGPGCVDCSRKKGVCQVCRRTVGPATRGVTLLAGTLNPLRKSLEEDPMKLIVPSGTSFRLWAAVKLDARVKQVPELTCVGGSLNYESSLFFVMTDQRGTVRVLFPEEPKIDVKAGVKPRPVTRNLTAQTWVVSRGRYPVGTYTVRAVAGRLISNPLTVIVSNKTKRRERPAQAVAAPHAPAGAGIAPQPQWKAGDTRVAAVDGATGKRIWEARMRFAIGNVAENGATWIVTSQDGTQRATLDAKSGKLIRMEKLKVKPANPGSGEGEVF